MLTHRSLHRAPLSDWGLDFYSTLPRPISLGKRSDPIEIRNAALINRTIVDYDRRLGLTLLILNYIMQGALALWPFFSNPRYKRGTFLLFDPFPKYSQDLYLLTMRRDYMYACDKRARAQDGISQTYVLAVEFYSLTSKP
jgi:hypothetical protein